MARILPTAFAKPSAQPLPFWALPTIVIVVNKTPTQARLVFQGLLWECPRNLPLGAWQFDESAEAGGMKANRLRWFLLFFLFSAVFQLPAQQSEADRKVFTDVRAGAEKGDPESQHLFPRRPGWANPDPEILRLGAESLPFGAFPQAPMIPEEQGGFASKQGVVLARTRIRRLPREPRLDETWNVRIFHCHLHNLYLVQRIAWQRRPVCWVISY
jgi:hypothetical protein